MIRKLIGVAVLLMALNFLFAVAGTVYVVRSAHVDRDKIKALKSVLYPPASEPTTVSTTAPATSPSDRLEQLLAKASGRTAAEQDKYIREAFEQENADLDRRLRELQDLKHQVLLAQQQVTSDRGKLADEKAELAKEQDERTKLMSDQGFQDSLTLYENMPAKQCKQLFMGLPESAVVDFLQAMPPATAVKIIKEFRSPEEMDRIHSVLEKLRNPQAATQPAVGPVGATGSGT